MVMHKYVNSTIKIHTSENFWATSDYCFSAVPSQASMAISHAATYPNCLCPDNWLTLRKPGTKNNDTHFSSALFKSAS